MQTYGNNDDDSKETKTFFVYGLAQIEAHTGKVMNFTPHGKYRIPEDALKQIYNYFDTRAPHEQWEWRTATDIAKCTGFWNKDDMTGVRRVARAMRSLIGSKAKRSGGKDYIFCPPVKHIL